MPMAKLADDFRGRNFQFIFFVAGELKCIAGFDAMNDESSLQTTLEIDLFKRKQTKTVLTRLALTS